MNLLLIMGSSFLLALSGALVPGPLFTVTVSESLRRGFRAGPLIILGHGILELAIVLILVSGIAPMLTGEGVKASVGLAGGVILVLMGLMVLKDAKKAVLDLSGGQQQKGMHPVLIGIVGSASNPYWSIWWITVGFGYLLAALKSGIPGVAVFFIGHISADLLWYSIISYSVEKGKAVLGQKGYRAVLFACGVFLIGFGAWFLSVSGR